MWKIGMYNFVRLQIQIRFLKSNRISLYKYLAENAHRLSRKRDTNKRIDFRKEHGETAIKTHGSAFSGNAFLRLKAIRYYMNLYLITLKTFPISLLPTGRLPVTECIIYISSDAADIVLIKLPVRLWRALLQNKKTSKKQFSASRLSSIVIVLFSWLKIVWSR